MKRYWLITFLGLFLVLSIQSSYAEEIRLVKFNQDEFSVVDTWFFVSTRDSENDEWVTKETNVVPLNPGNTCWFWVIQLETDWNYVGVKEVFKCPYPPEIWGREYMSVYTVSDDRTTAVTYSTAYLNPDNNLVRMGMWCAMEGDPIGDHEWDVYIDEILVKTFKFFVTPVNMRLGIEPEMEHP